MQGIHANYYVTGDGQDYSRSHITVSVRSVYGNELVYPADDTAALFASLIGAKMFNAKQIGQIRALGYAVHVCAGQLPAGF